MLIRRYRRALLRALLAVVIVGFAFSCVASLGRGLVYFDGFWNGVFTGTVISAISAVGAMIVSAVVMRLADPHFARSETTRTVIVFFASGAGAFLAWVVVGIIESFRSGTFEWIGVWFIMGFITSVVAAVGGFTLIALDERRLRLNAESEHEAT